MRHASSVNIGAALGYGAMSERLLAFKVTLAFLAFGVAWMLLTDLLVYRMTADAGLIEWVETAKGVLFVMVSAAIIFGMSWHAAGKLARARRTIAAIIESIADGVILISKERNIVHANPAAVRMLHATDLREVVGLRGDDFARMFRVTRPDGTPLWPESYLALRVFEEPGPMHHKVVLHPREGGEVIILSTASPVRPNVDSVPDLVVIAMTDVTELERAERVHDEFLAVAAHSLKTPVAILKSSSQHLRLRGGHTVAKPAAAIERQCARLEQMTDNLLVLSRLRSGTLQLYPVDVDLASVVERIARETERLRPGHDVRAQVSPGLKATVDPERLVLALRNVIDEAMRSADHHSAVTLLARRSPVDVELGVTWRPRDPDDLSSAPDERYDNVGLRRHVTTAVLEAHGGVVRDEATARLRTTWLVLPLEEAPHGDRR